MQTGAPKPAADKIIGMGPFGWGVVSLFCNVMLVPTAFALATGLQTLSRLRRSPGGGEGFKRIRREARVGIAMAIVWPVSAVAGAIALVAFMGPKVLSGFEQGIHQEASRVRALEETRRLTPPAEDKAAEPVEYVVVPYDHDTSQPLPTLIWLHGYGGDADLVIDPYFQRLADRYAIAIVGISGPWVYEPAGDDEKESARAFRWTEHPDRDALRIEEALARIADRVKPQAGQTVLFGFSQGAVVAAEVAARDTGRYAGAILLSPGSLGDGRRILRGVLPSPQKQRFIVSVGKVESAWNLHLAKTYHDRLSFLGHRSSHREAAEQTGHAFPPAFFRELPVWLENILGPRGGITARTTEEALIEAQLAAAIDAQIEEGFSSRETILAAATEQLGATSVKHPEPLLSTLLERRLDKRAADERAWPAVTDCDRLDRAFAALETKGILARQNYQDCSTCGHAAISDEVAAERKAGRRARGYVFFHEQDTEAVAQGGVLLLAYGSYDEDPRATAAVGKDIVAQLRRAGLRTKWNGKPDARIAVEMAWKRRWVTRAPSVQR